MLRQLAALLLVTIFSLGPAFAVLSPDEMLEDPALEERARALSLEVRCMVCQNQSIEDSDAPLARDLRLLIRERISDGNTDEQVLDFLVARYGEFVLLRPQLAAHTLLLWAAPALLLAIGASGMLLWLFRRRNLVTAEALNEEEERALSRILDDGR